jgi:hypothetical protein
MTLPKEIKKIPADYSDFRRNYQRLSARSAGKYKNNKTVRILFY